MYNIFLCFFVRCHICNNNLSKNVDDSMYYVVRFLLNFLLLLLKQTKTKDDRAVVMKHWRAHLFFLGKCMSKKKEEFFLIFLCTIRILLIYLFNIIGCSLFLILKGLEGNAWSSVEVVQTFMYLRSIRK